MSRGTYWNLLQLDEIDALNVAVDAVTVSNSVGSESDRLKSRAFVSELANTLGEEFFEGHAVKWHKVGVAKGWKRGSVGYASAPNFNVMSVTGERTREAIDLILDYDGELKCTRIDFNLDLVLKRERPDLADRIYNRHPKRLDEKKLRMIKSATGHTLYVNQRGSSQFGRMYDKSIAYNFALGTVWRYEVQYGQRKAASMLAGLRKHSGDIEGMVKSVVSAQYRKWDIPMPLIPDTYEIPSVELQFTMVDTRFDWLKRCAPTIRAMAYEREEEVREILNLPMFP